MNLLAISDFELNEIGTPPQIKWNKCKLETVSFGHGIMTTPLQAAAAYAAILFSSPIRSSPLAIILFLASHSL